MKRVLPFFFAGLFFSTVSDAQYSRYIVRLKNKGATTFTLANPSPYLSARAIERRTRYGIPVDSADLPIPASYLTQIRNIPNVAVLNTSRWLNAVTIQTSDANALNAINALAFVQSSSGIAARNEMVTPDKFNEEIVLPISVAPIARPMGTEADYFNYGTNSFNEIHLHQGEFLHNIGLRGQAMQIAMLDAGFFNYHTLDAMDSIVANGQVLSTWDFVNRETSVSEDDSHGMQCLSTIAANIPGQFIGKAPKANFHLFKTEDVTSETPIEEFNWVCGAERADSSGTDVISSSIGYNTFDDASFSHTYNDMDGNTTISAIGADIAARKGLLLFNSIGNDGTSPWHFLVTPSDADSVVAVGAVNSAGTIWPASAYGPASDGRIKPDVASIGFNATIQTTGNTIGSGNGTSFACPNMAGLATCLWQGFPEFRNMRIVRALKEAGSTYNNPNDRIGYGIPNMKTAFSALLTEYATSTASLNSCNVTFNWNSKDVAAMKYEIERKKPGEVNYSKVGELNPQPGTVLTNHSYQFTNMIGGVTSGTVSYRIRQIIDTAAASFAAVYIDTANVTLASSCATTGINGPVNELDKIVVVPNPTQSDASLVIETGSAIADLSINIHDINGRLVLQLKKSKPAGRTAIDLPVNKLSKGTYIVSVYDKSRIIGTADLLKY